MTKYNNSLSEKEQAYAADKVKADADLYSETLSQREKESEYADTYGKDAATEKAVYERLRAALSAMDADDARDALRNDTFSRTTCPITTTICCTTNSADEGACMRLKDKLKTKGFWIRIVSAVIVILQAFGLKLDAPAVNEILTAVVGSRSAGHFRHRVRPGRPPAGRQRTVRKPTPAPKRPTNRTETLDGPYGKRYTVYGMKMLFN